MMSVDTSVIRAVQKFSKHSIEKAAVTLAFHLDKNKDCSLYTLSVLIKHTGYISTKAL